MRHSSPLDLSGVFPPLTTPFNADESLAIDQLRENVAQYNRTLLAGYVVTGSTGEALFLTHEETERLWAEVRQAAPPEKILIAGTGAESTSQTIHLTNSAARLGYAAALVRTPHYFKSQMTPDALAEYFLRVADAARIPILIYSVPQFTGIAVEAPLVARLSEHPNIIGIKESSGNVQRIAEIVASVRAGFAVLVGSAATFYPSLAVGAAGGILALACALPNECVELYHAARSGEMQRAQQLQLSLLPAATSLVSRFGVSGLKYSLDRLGYYGGPARRPLLSLSESAKHEIDEVLAAFATRVISAR
jgi:4-hydroxy-2-oxoglutarate aldolase